MAAAALVALVHDIVATIGIYALIGFDVTPATVIGFLTILGYSLYDTVVIFDKVRENTKGITAQNQYTYAEAANLGLNQTLMRSINTSSSRCCPSARSCSSVRVARRRHPEGPVAGVVRRSCDRHVLVDLHRHSVAGRPQESRADARRPSLGGSRPGERRRFHAG